MTETMICARGLVKRYGDLEAVAGIDLDVAAAEVFGFLGPNGAGKTSTMRMIGCVTSPTSGTLHVLGLDVRRHGARIRANLGVVPQHDTLDWELTVLENLTTYGRLFGVPRRVVRERALRLLEFVQLTDRAKDRVEPLSGGMKRRLTIARALISEPDILLLDEPTTGLDPQARHLVWDRLFELKSRGVTLVLTTHYMDEAERLCDRLVVLDRGRVVARGSPGELIARYVPPEVVELRFADRDGAVVEELAEFGDRVETVSDRALLYVRDGDSTVARLYERGIIPSQAQVRRSTLEDVFLHLTGRTLVE